MLAKNIANEKQDPRIQRTRKLLVQALGELIGEKSFQSITVSQIAERATLNRVTFYAHFRDKFDLLEYSVREQIRERIESRLGKNSTYTEANLQKLIQVVAEFLSEMNRHCPPPQGQLHPLMEKQVTQELYETLFDWLSDVWHSRSSRGPNAEQAAMVASWAIYGAALQWSQAAEPAPHAAFVAQVFPLINNNLAAFTKAPEKQKVRVAGGSASGLMPHLRLQWHNI